MQVVPVVDDEILARLSYKEETVSCYGYASTLENGMKLMIRMNGWLLALVGIALAAQQSV